MAVSVLGELSARSPTKQSAAHAICSMRRRVSISGTDSPNLAEVRDALQGSRLEEIVPGEVVPRSASCLIR